MNKLARSSGGLIVCSVNNQSRISLWISRKLGEEIIDHGVNVVGWLPPPLLPRKTIVERPHGVVQPGLDLLVDLEVDLGFRKPLPYQIRQFESSRTWPART